MTREALLKLAASLRAAADASRTTNLDACNAYEDAARRTERLIPPQQTAPAREHLAPPPPPPPELLSRKPRIKRVPKGL